jgi:signal peptidase I
MKVCQELAVAAQKAEDTVRKKSAFRECAESIIIALIIAFFVRTFVVQSFKIPSGSMEDTLAVGDHLLVGKFIYGIRLPFTDKRVLKVRDPRRGDVIVFEYPKDRSKDFIKRVIGTPGDKILVHDKKVYVNGAAYENVHAKFSETVVLPKELSPRDNSGLLTVPDDSYFVMGDNRDNSYDSRFWGFVKKEDIKGLALVKYWSWDNDGFKVRWGNIGRLIT